MQTKKESVHEQIAAAAKEVFLRKGFMKTAMHDIAKGAGVGVSNIYNYFRSKDELFRYIVTPLIVEMERMLQEHHNTRYQDQFQKYANEGSDEMMKEHMQAYIRLIGNHKDEMKLILYKAQGSSLENFIDDYTEECTRQVVEFMDDYKRKRPQTGMVRTRFTYHVHTVWMFSFMSEVIKHRLTFDEMEKAVEDYVQFEFAGWSEVMKIEN